MSFKNYLKKKKSKKLAAAACSLIQTHCVGNDKVCSITKKHLLVKMNNKSLLKENTFLHGISSNYQYMSKIGSLHKTGKYTVSISAFINKNTYYGVKLALKGGT